MCDIRIMASSGVTVCRHPPEIKLHMTCDENHHHTVVCCEEHVEVPLSRLVCLSCLSSLGKTGRLSLDATPRKPIRFNRVGIL